MEWKELKQNLINSKYYYFHTENGVLLCGDCLEAIKLIPDESIDLLIADPPYGISKQNNFSTMRRNRDYKGIDFGDWDREFDQRNWILLAGTKIKNNSNVIIFNCWENLYFVSCVLKQIGVDVKRPLVLKKKNPPPFNRDRMFLNSFEFGLWGVKGKWVFNRRDMKYKELFWECLCKRHKYNHPTQKPLDFICFLVDTLSDKNNLILDPFLGSGTTAVACEKLNRRWIGIEINPEYCEIAKQRIQDYLNDKGV